MKFLLDEHIDPVVAELLEEQGFEVEQVKELKKGIEDREIVIAAKENNSVIVTRDDDFLNIKQDFKNMPGIIKVNGFPKPSTLKQKIINKTQQLNEENMVNTVLYV